MSFCQRFINCHAVLSRAQNQDLDTAIQVSELTKLVRVTVSVKSCLFQKLNYNSGKNYCGQHALMSICMSLLVTSSEKSPL